MKISTVMNFKTGTYIRFTYMGGTNPNTERVVCVEKCNNYNETLTGKIDGGFKSFKYDLMKNIQVVKPVKSVKRVAAAKKSVKKSIKKPTKTKKAIRVIKNVKKIEVVKSPTPNPTPISTPPTIAYYLEFDDDNRSVRLRVQEPDFGTYHIMRLYQDGKTISIGGIRNEEKSQKILNDILSTIRS